MAMKSATVRHPRIVAIALLCGVTPVLAQQASIAGLVTDSASRHPLVSAQVLVGGTTLRTLTDRAGRFRFDAVPAGAGRPGGGPLAVNTRRRPSPVAGGAGGHYRARLAARGPR